MQNGPVFVGRDGHGEAQCYLPIGKFPVDPLALIYDRGQVRLGLVETVGVAERTLQGRHGLLCAAMRERRSAAQLDLRYFGLQENGHRRKVLYTAMQLGYVREVAIPVVCTFRYPEEATSLIEDPTLPLLVKAALLPLLAEHASYVPQIFNETRRAMRDPLVSRNDALAAAAAQIFTRGRIVHTEEDFGFACHLTREGVYGELISSNLLPWATELSVRRPQS